MSTAHVEVSDSNSYYFTNVRDNDMIFRTASNSQQIHFGVNSNATSQMVINSNAINLLGNLTISRAPAFNGIEISRKSEIGGSVNLNTTVLSIPGYTQDSASNIIIAGSDAIRFNIGATSNMMTLTTSNLEMNGNISLTKQVNFTGIQLSRRTLPGEMQNITNTVTSVPGFLQDTSSNITVSGSNSVNVICGGTQVATFSSNSLNLGTATAPYNICAGNLGMFRNRIINGDMRIDQRGAGAGLGGLTGSNLAYNIQPSSFYTLDRFAIASPNIGALTANKVNLSSSDVSATGFTSAAAVGLVPNDSLSVYLPLDGNLTDASGNNVSLTTTGTMQYVTANVIGTNALYLANEANVTGGTAAANYVRATSFTFSTQFSVSMWMLCTNINVSNSSVAFATNSGTSALNNSIWIARFASGVVSCGFWLGNRIDSTALAANQWVHTSLTYNGALSANQLTLYVNGSFAGSVTGTLAQNGFMFGNASTTTTANTFAGFIDDFRIYNRVLSPSEVAALATNVGIPASPSSTSWLTRLTFDNTTADAQGGLTNIAVRGTTAYTPCCVIGTAALDLTVNTAGGTATNCLTYTLASGSYSLPLTISGWINASSVSAIQDFITIGNDTNTATLSALLNIEASGKLGFGVHVGSWIPTFTAFTISAGRWYHVAMTVTSSSYLNAYVNGILAISTPIPAGSMGVSSGTGSPTQVRIGAQTGTSFATAYKGLIDDVRIYNRVLTSQEITGMYASSQYAAYSLFQQTIEGNNLSDLFWGTSAAQAVTASMWIKNNSATSQQFSISATNAGSGLIAWLPFESSLADSLGYLTNATAAGTSFSTSIFKVGTASLNFTGNTAGGTANNTVLYNLNAPLTYPLTVSLWIYASVVTGGQIPFAIGQLAPTFVNWTWELVINTSGQLFVDVAANSSNISALASASTAIVANTWYHVAATHAIGGNTILYINGVQVSVSSGTIPPTGVIINSTALPLQLMLGARNLAPGTGAFQGYIDDVRIYNRALTTAQILQIYQNNATTTTPSTYLTPRSVVYNTPSIPANSWQRVAFTIPGDTASNLWLTDTNAGLTLAVCLGASSLYNTTNVAASSNNTLAVWNSVTDFMGNSAQQYGSSSTNLLSSVANSVYITGVQLEKGPISTPFEFRPFGIEYQLCNRYYWRKVNETFYEILGVFIADTTTYGYGQIKLPVKMRGLPSFSVSLVTDIHGVGTITDDVNDQSTELGQYKLTGSGFTQGAAYVLRFLNKTPGTAWVAFSAEL